MTVDDEDRFAPGEQALVDEPIDLDHGFVDAVAANVRSQLESGKNEDDAYAGLQAVFKAYEQVQAKDKEFKVEEIEKLRQLDKDGKLKAHIDELKKQR